MLNNIILGLRFPRGKKDTLLGAESSRSGSITNLAEDI
jgi:hypothetical protein